MRKKKSFFDKQYLRQVTAYALAAVVSVGFVYYVFRRFTDDLSDDVTTLYMKETTASDVILCDAYILKDEIPLYSDAAASGSPAPTVAEGGKVGARDKVADIYVDYSPAVTNQIRILEDQISFYKRCASQNNSGGTGAIDETIAGDIVSLCRASASGDAVGAVGCRDRLLSDMRRREALTGKITDYEEKIAAIEREISSLRASLGTSLGSVYAPEAGYYFSSSDGYERTFTSEGISSLTYSAFRDMLSASPENTGRTSAGKLARDYRWYTACPMSTEDALSMTIGRSYTVTLSKNALYPMEMTLYRVLNGGDESVAIFRCDRIMEGYDYDRAQTASVTTAERQVFKVPVTAVRQYDGDEGVFVLDQVTIGFRRIDIIREENGYFLCAIPPKEEEEGEHPWMRENDVVVVTGTGLAVGMTYAPKQK